MKQIYVQAQADHIESLFKGSPLAAIEELVWNALDADAKEVKVDLITNPLGAVDAVRITDDGTGIDVLKADQTFGNLGGSWKREGKGTAFSGRRLHGRHGRGRFKAFALGMNVESAFRMSMPVPSSETRMASTAPSGLVMRSIFTSLASASSAFQTSSSMADRGEPLKRDSM